MGAMRAVCRSVWFRRMTAPNVKLTRRDLDLLESLYRDPKTARQVLRESVIYSEPFPSLDRVQERLGALAQAGFVDRVRAPFAGSELGSPPYWYRLTRTGFVGRFGGEVLPRTGFFRRRPSTHAMALAEWNIHTYLAAQADGEAVIEMFVPENEWRFETGGGVLLPDATYRFRLPDGRRYTFFVELDNGTETQVYRMLKGSTIEEKVRRYERLHYEVATQKQFSPFRVLFICTSSRIRAGNILATARRVVRERRRVIFYAGWLPDYLHCDGPLRAPVFRDQQGRAIGLLPETASVVTDGEVCSWTGTPEAREPLAAGAVGR